MGNCNASLSGRLALPAGLIAALALGCTLEDPEELDEADESAASSSSTIEESERRTRHRSPKLTPQQSGTVNRLQAVSPVDSRVVWASGVGGTYALTTDGGKNWQSSVVPGAEALEFRDVEGVSEDVAYLMAAGLGTDSRIYKTVDGGATWSLQFENQDPNGFYDCFSFWTPRRGITMADAIDGRFPVVRTLDGETWQDIGDNLPAGQTGEAAFAASGTCVATLGRKRAWIATGAAAAARVLATTDGGETWDAYDTPIVQGTPSSGGFSVAFRDRRHGILGGGELAAPDQLSDNFARSRDGGKTWQLATGSPFPGAIFGLSYALGRDHHDHHHPWCERVSDTDGDERGRGGWHRRHAIVATGPGGAAWSPDEGDTWFLLEGVADYWAVAFANRRTGWLVGTEGRILKVELPVR
jgi:photosystem II stability/assembly factor-like uncharacterized protein